MEKSQIVGGGSVQRVSELSFQKLNIEIDEIQQNIINTTISSWSPKKNTRRIGILAFGVTGITITSLIITMGRYLLGNGIRGYNPYLLIAAIILSIGLLDVWRVNLAIYRNIQADLNRLEAEISAKKIERDQHHTFIQGDSDRNGSL